MKQPELFLCRANGEGSHNFRVASDEAGVMAFYKEMFGEEDGGGIQLAIDHFRETENWSNNGEAYYCELYCATFEVWKVHASELEWARPEIDAPFRPTHQHKEGGIYEMRAMLKMHVGGQWQPAVLYRNEHRAQFVREIHEFYRRFDTIEPEAAATSEEKAPPGG